MAKYNYHMLPHWSQPDQLWVVEVPELPGCFADGETPAQAIANPQEVIAPWIETARKHGMAIPQPPPGGCAGQHVAFGLPSERRRGQEEWR